jgi:hypothetical protein
LCIAVCVGLLTWLATASFFGETDFTKGIAFVIGGIAASACDLGHDLSRRGEEHGVTELLSPDWGGCVVVIPSALRMKNK